MSTGPDSYTKSAKKAGYPARSVFKLIEMQKKYGIIKKGDQLLDIGAAPGSWSIYIIKEFKSSVKVVGVDLKELKLDKSKGGSFFFIQGDIYEEDIYTRIKERGPYNVILSDAAPSTTGDRLVDTSRSYDLSLRIINIAKNILLGGGNLVIKIFQGGDEKKILEMLKKLFKWVKAFKPVASRKKSMEIYYIGINFR